MASQKNNVGKKDMLMSKVMNDKVSCFFFIIFVMLLLVVVLRYHLVLLLSYHTSRHISLLSISVAMLQYKFRIRTIATKSEIFYECHVTC